MCRVEYGAIPQGVAYPKENLGTEVMVSVAKGLNAPVKILFPKVLPMSHTFLWYPTTHVRPHSVRMLQPEQSEVRMLW